MNLNKFDLFRDSESNLLPKDGTVNYFGKIFSLERSDYYLEKLLNTIEWKNDEAVMFGKLIVTKRKVAWYGSIEFEYTYSNVTKRALPWTKELSEGAVTVKELPALNTTAQYPFTLPHPNDLSFPTAPKSSDESWRTCWTSLADSAGFADNTKPARPAT